MSSPNMGRPDYFGQLVSWIQYHLLHGDTPAEVLQSAEAKYPGYSQSLLLSARAEAELAIDVARNLQNQEVDQPIIDAYGDQVLPTLEIGVNLRYLFPTGQIDPETGKETALYRTYQVRAGVDETMAEVLERANAMYDERYGEVADLEAGLIELYSVQLYPE